MRVTIPTLDDRGLGAAICEHFGHTPYFTTVDTETGDVEAIPNSGQHHGGGRTPAEIIVDAGAEAVLCGGLGRRAVRLFQDAGIQVFMGAEGTVQDALNAFRDKKLTPATEDGACPGHD